MHTRWVCLLAACSFACTTSTTGVMAPDLTVPASDGPPGSADLSGGADSAADALMQEADAAADVDLYLRDVEAAVDMKAKADRPGKAPDGAVDHPKPAADIGGKSDGSQMKPDALQVEVDVAPAPDALKPDLMHPPSCTIGGACDDGDPCTSGDTWVSWDQDTGACVCQGTSYTCKQPDKCHLAACDGKGGCLPPVFLSGWCYIEYSTPGQKVCIKDGQGDYYGCHMCQADAAGGKWISSLGGYEMLMPSLIGADDHPGDLSYYCAPSWNSSGDPKWLMCYGGHTATTGPVCDTCGARSDSPQCSDAAGRLGGRCRCGCADDSNCTDLGAATKCATVYNPQWPYNAWGTYCVKP